LSDFLKYLESHVKTRSEMKSLIETRLKDTPCNMAITWMNMNNFYIEFSQFNWWNVRSLN